MRTTSNEFKEQVQAHIMECLSEDETTNPTEQLANAKKDFLNWYGPYEQKRTPNHQAAFCEWLTGLPSSLSVEYEYYKVAETMKQWFTSVGMDYNEKKSGTSEEFELYLYLIYREFKTLCKKNGVALL